MELRNTPGRPSPEPRLGLDSKAKRTGESLPEGTRTPTAPLESAKLQRAAHSDTVELSATAQLFTSETVEGDAARNELVEELRRAYESGTLNSRERIQLAAQRLLLAE